MFLKKLTIANGDSVVRSISFKKGINLIVDETKTSDRKESGNNVGKTTVLRLIDYCFGSDGKNIYKDTEFREKGNTTIENFLKGNNIIITLTLKEDLDLVLSDEITIRRNFRQYREKIKEINGKKYTDSDFLSKLKELIFHSTEDKPTFRQIISRNIRDEKNRLQNTLKVLHPTTKAEEYEALYLFWLGISLAESDRKQRLLAQRKVEEDLQSRLRKDSNPSQIEQSLIVISRTIKELSRRKDSFNLNECFEADLSELNRTKSEINRLSTELSRLELRRDLILESKVDLEKDLSNIDVSKIRRLYDEAKLLVPKVQKSFEDLLSFHNQMISAKIKYITQELPAIEENVLNSKQCIASLLVKEKQLSERVRKTGAVEELQKIITESNQAFEKKGNLEEQKRQWKETQNNLDSIKNELDLINQGISSKEELIQQRITEFNKYFADISFRLYGEQFVLSSDRNEKGYELNISSIAGNLGTGKKKGQIAAFDLAYIQFADALDIDCLHFITHDQIENIHDNQISSLLTQIVSEVNCQYVLPVLRDKLPQDIPIKQYEVLSLSQSDKLFRV